MSFGSVTDCTSLAVKPGAISFRRSPFGVTSITAKSVKIIFTLPAVVGGKVKFFHNLGIAINRYMFHRQKKLVCSGDQVHRAADIADIQSA